MMEYRDGMFQEILGDYALFEVKKAFMEHIKQSSDLPTPSDILKIIEDDRKYRMIKNPDIAMLIEYESKGIELSEKQRAILNNHRLS